MDGTCRDITKAIRRYDRELYCTRSLAGVRCIYRHGKAYNKVATFDDGSVLYSLVPNPFYICALTSNWETSGTPRSWGIDAILFKLKSMDFWERNRIIDEMDAHNEKVEESRKRAHLNETEAFLSDYRRPLAKAFEDINTTSLGKGDKRKRLKEKKEELKIKGSS